jgi:rRNA maturation endonuclease Nob1
MWWPSTIDYESQVYYSRKIVESKIEHLEDSLFECSYCSSTFKKEDALKKGRCPNCGAPLKGIK